MEDDRHVAEVTIVRPLAKVEKIAAGLNGGHCRHMVMLVSGGPIGTTGTRPVLRGEFTLAT